MAKFYVEHDGSNTTITIYCERTGYRIEVLTEELVELKKTVNAALRNIQKYGNSSTIPPNDDCCWVMLELDGGVRRPCLQPKDKCVHRGKNNFEIQVRPGPCVLPAKYRKRAKIASGGPSSGSEPHDTDQASKLNPGAS